MSQNGSSDLVPTSAYSYGSYPFEFFNPTQSIVFPHIESDTNVVVEAKTSSGKTICAEIIAGKSLCNDEKIIYLSPLKALAEEKMSDWAESTHPWSSCNKVIFTGDYKLTEARIKEANNADIIVCTFEMLAVRCRNYSRERCSWVTSASTLIVDEAHFVGSDGRGDHLETALLSFTVLNPDCRIVFLSATLTNSSQVADWLKTLNGKETVLVQSDYRPCKLTLHYPTYEPAPGNPWQTRAANKRSALNVLGNLITKHNEDQWLIFCHTKGDIQEVVGSLKPFYRDKVAYHNADLSKSERRRVESEFKDGTIRYLAATSTLAYGLNLPARRVAIFGTLRGLGEVDPLDVIQELGRAGRPRYDKEGDGYLILPSNRFSTWKKWVEDGIEVRSKLPRHVRFHAIGEIANNHAHTANALQVWFQRSLAFHQTQVPMTTGTVVEDFQRYNLIKCHEERFVASHLGIIASRNYFDPIDVAVWASNFRTLMERNIRMNDSAIAWAVANIDAHYDGYVPKDFAFHTSDYLHQLKPLGLSMKSKGALAMATTFALILEGEDHKAKSMFSKIIGFKADLQRLMSCLQAVDTQYLGNRDRSYWKKLYHRFMYGVSWQQADLCAIPGIGKKYSQVLLDFGIDTPEKFYQNKSIVETVIPKRLLDKAYAQVPSD